jgi:hypothetical protein
MPAAAPLAHACSQEKTRSNAQEKNMGPRRRLAESPHQRIRAEPGRNASGISANFGAQATADAFADAQIPDIEPAFVSGIRAGAHLTERPTR